jgi:diguanylate cyclase (GGDEF)-like protein
MRGNRPAWLPGTGSFGQRMSLLALVTSGTALATLMAAFLAMASVNAHRMLRNRVETLVGITGQTAAAAALFHDRSTAMSVLEALRSDPAMVSACLYDRRRLLAEYQRDRNAAVCPLEDRAAALPESGFVTASRDLQWEGNIAGRLVLRSDEREITQRWRRMLTAAAGMFLVSLAMGGFTASLLQRRLARPVYALTSAMREVTEHHNFAVRVDIQTCAEMSLLGRGFNTMLAELEKLANEKREFARRLQQQALTDDLTGLPNRRLLSDRLSHALAVARREGHQVALLYIDLDGFKLVNDSLGHAVGDLLLRQVSARFRSRVRSSDSLARLGGDEFAVAIAGQNVREQASVAAIALLNTLAPPFFVEQHELTVTASIGMSVFPDHGTTPMDLLQQADSAMFAAKKLGKNRLLEFCDELGSSLRERMQLQTELRSAIARGELRAFYQPQFDLATGSLVRFEALARWTHPTLGFVPPATFIPVAEETGLIVPLGHCIMETACREALRWQSLAPGPVQVAVNVSSLELMRDEYVGEVADILRQTGLDPRLLQIELTESVTLNGSDRVGSAMCALAQMGVSLAIDDFGTGYSCLSYLPRLPFDALKIDRSFISGLGVTREIAALVQSLVTLAHNFGMKVVAEGIETPEQMKQVADIGCNEAQGYLLGKPTSEPEIYLATASPVPHSLRVSSEQISRSLSACSQMKL